MSEFSRTNIVLEVISQRPHATKNRNGDVYLFGKGLKNYIGSASLLSKLKFERKGELVPKDMIVEKYISEVITDEEFDDLEVYIAYTKDGKLIMPTPASEKHARSWRYRYYDCTVSGSTAWPQIFDIGDGVLRSITLLCDREEPDKTFKIYSHWTYTDKAIVPAYFQYE
jgi:hypothetical protein